MKSTNRDAQEETIMQEWSKATRLFSNASGMRPRLSWLTGLSIDTRANRLQRLLKQNRAAALGDILAELNERDIRRFHHYADVNLERAAAAMRLNLVVNISAPIGALVIVNQLFPQLIPYFVDEYGMDAIIAGALGALSLLLLSIWYCYAGVSQARDLKHLSDLYRADRDSRRRRRDEFNDDPLDPAELA